MRWKRAMTGQLCRASTVDGHSRRSIDVRVVWWIYQPISALAEIPNAVLGAEARAQQQQRNDRVKCSEDAGICHHADHYRAGHRNKIKIDSPALPEPHADGAGHSSQCSENCQAQEKRHLAFIDVVFAVDDHQDGRQDCIGKDESQSDGQHGAALFVVRDLGAFAALLAGLARFARCWRILLGCLAGSCLALGWGFTRTHDF